MGGLLAPTPETIEYSRYTKEPAKEGETRLLRNPLFADGDLPTAREKIKDIKYTMEVFHKNVEIYPNNDFIGKRKHKKDEEFGEYEFLTYKQTNEIVENLKYAFEKLGLTKKIYVQEHEKDFKFIGINGINTLEWILTELACLDTATTVACMVDTSVIEHVLNETQTITLQCDSISLKSVIDLLKEKKLQYLQNIIVVPFYCEPKEKMEANIQAIKNFGINVYYHSELIEIGKEYRKENEGKIQFDIPNEDTVNFLVYTSGSTGVPKGAMITNRTQKAQSVIFELYGKKLGPNDTSTMLYLPLSHNYGQVVLFGMMSFGAKIGVFSGKATRIMEDARAMNPITLPGVPRIFEKIVQEIEGNVKKLKPFWQRLYSIALKTKLENYEKYGTVNHWFYDKLIFSQINNVVGSKIENMGTSSAPAQKGIIRKIRCLLNVDIVDGYGATEANCILSTSYKNFRDDFTGGPFGCLEIKLVNAPELNYYVTDVDPKTGMPQPRGEIYVRGPVVIKGYFKDLENTKRLFDEEGFYHTGDIATILNGVGHKNAIKIIDRRTNFFKLSQGEFIIPDKIQTVLKNSKFIDLLCVCGSGNHNYLVGIISPKKEGVVEYLVNNGHADATIENVENYYDDENLLQAIIKDCDEIGRANGLKGYELIKKCYLSRIPFNEESGLTTNMLKVKFIEVKKRFAQQINDMYGITEIKK